MTQTSITIGTRKSQLALAQTNFVIEKLKIEFPDLEINVIPMSTTGDLNLTQALPKMNDKALFTKELDIALLDRRVDMVVHSLKDVPTTLPPGLLLGAIMEREDPRDVLVCKSKYEKGTKLIDLPDGAVIGTSSWRRTAQIKRNYPKLIVENIRGNLNTRMRKLEEENYDAIIVAYAGMKRLNWTERISSVIDYEEIYYAVGQAALAIQCRESDAFCLSLLNPLNHQESFIRCSVEREFLRTLEGGCSVPIGVNCFILDNEILLKGVLISLDGSKQIESEKKISLEKWPSLGTLVATEIIKEGSDILNEIRRLKNS
ncbi:porphobilinogen deaminase [Rozella allomycis CSF55]|uniref:hydroxymethylbilane synthase n=1 Tax=Rozella allomycis (strain CSF55) TaxID=988480 RepID=A0A075APW9_ROZAC|nr:Porphobilinogen deaminase domain-containing protein [Rozella allomycis CSF55]RKP21175.1 porphobilinogen deaminase [Rozella allomycis CSF55]|eukprot:EPZ32228.1 Porphobilinogen deaminase domain-containing protein [Rozella allomycis CSF55]